MRPLHNLYSICRTFEELKLESQISHKCGTLTDEQLAQFGSNINRKNKSINCGPQTVLLAEREFSPFRICVSSGFGSSIGTISPLESKLATFQYKEV